jgi:hypothetical protein
MHLHEDVLGDVLHPQASRADTAAHQVENPAPIAIEEIAKGLRIAPDVRAQQRRIGVVGGHGVATSQS